MAKGNFDQGVSTRNYEQVKQFARYGDLLHYFSQKGVARKGKSFDEFMKLAKNLNRNYEDDLRYPDLAKKDIIAFLNIATGKTWHS